MMNYAGFGDAYLDTAFPWANFTMVGDTFRKWVDICPQTVFDQAAADHAWDDGPFQVDLSTNKFED